MPKEGLSLREEQFVDLLPTNDWIVWKAGVEAGFSESYAKDRLPALIKPNGTSSKVVLIEAIEAKKSEIQAKTDFDRAESEQMLRASYAVAQAQKQPVAMTSAVRELNCLYGLHNEPAEGRDRQPRQFTAEELAELKVMAKRLTGIKVVKIGKEA